MKNKEGYGFLICYIVTLHYYHLCFLDVPYLFVFSSKGQGCLMSTEMAAAYLRHIRAGTETVSEGPQKFKKKKKRIQLE